MSNDRTHVERADTRAEHTGTCAEHAGHRAKRAGCRVERIGRHAGRTGDAPHSGDSPESRPKPELRPRGRARGKAVRLVAVAALAIACLCAGGALLAFADNATPAANAASGNPFKVEGDASSWKWDAGNNQLVIRGTQPVVVGNLDQSTAAGASIVVNPGNGKTARVTLNGVNVNVSSTPYRAAMLVSSGALELTLADGSENRLTSGQGRAGLQNDERSLTVKGGEAGTGTLVATGGSDAAGIGGGDGGTGANITVEGGVVTATGASGGAGIGGGDGASAANIAIKGGHVTAKSSGGSSAGIGGGFEGTATDIAISGGTVIATGTASGAGIGGGYGAAASNITIKDATVTATGGSDGAGIGGGWGGAATNIAIESAMVAATGGGAGIGGGYRGAGTHIAITDSSVTATGSDAGIGGGYGGAGTDIAITDSDVVATGGGAGIGGGGYGGVGADIAIKGGTVVAKGGDGDAGIGGSSGAAGTDITIEDATVIATGTGSGAGIGGGYAGAGERITITNSVVTATNEGLAAGIGGGYGRAGTGIVIEGSAINATGGMRAMGIGAGCDSNTYSVTIRESVFSRGSLGTADADGQRGTVCDVAPQSGYLVYTNWDEETRREYPYRVDLSWKKCPFVVTGDATAWTWNPEDKTVTVRGESPLSVANASDGTVYDARIVIDPGEGKTAHVTFDGVRVEQGSSSDAPAVPVRVASGALELTLGSGQNSLRAGSGWAALDSNGHPVVIRDASDGTATLYAKGGEKAAAIGSSFGSEEAADIVIEGGAITAEGGSGAAGIGGASQGPGAKVAISGGAIVATGGSSSSAIGSGNFASSVADVAISGGTVNATGGSEAAAIGEGYRGSGASVTIAGGAVTATGGLYGTGIGAASSASAVSRVVIEGGDVTATGGAWAAGIGSGQNGYGNADLQTHSVAISGGTVAATGGEGAAGIGSGRYGWLGVSISISGGTVTAKGGAGAAGIGAGESGGMVESPVVISGGAIAAEGGSGAQDIGTGRLNASESPVTIAGGAFAKGEIDLALASRGTVYGMEPVEGTMVFENCDAATAQSHPYCVATPLFRVEGGVPDSWMWDEANRALVVAGEDELSIANAKAGETVTDASIVVRVGGGKTAHVTLDGVDINASSVAGRAALLVESGALELTLADGSKNSLKSGEHCAGLQSGGNLLTIKGAEAGTGELVAIGGAYGAGIGGGEGSVVAGVTIEGGIVAATGGRYGAGVGSANTHESVAVAITGGTLTATGGRWAAGIGAGVGGPQSVIDIAIEGGAVAATPGYDDRAIASAIGNGANASNYLTVAITGGVFADDGGTAANLPESRGTVYGHAPQEGFVVLVNDGGDAGTYPWKVASAPAASIVLKADAAPVYDGEALAAGDVLESAAYGETDASAAVTFQWRVAGSEGAWTDGLPMDAGTYEVRASLAAGTYDGVSYAGASVTGEVAIAKAQLTEVTVADPSKKFDGRQVSLPTVTAKGVKGEIVAVNPESEADAGKASFAWYAKGDDGEWVELDAAPCEVGSYKVAASLAESTNYNAATGEREFVIEKAASKMGLTVKGESGDVGSEATVTFGDVVTLVATPSFEDAAMAASASGGAAQSIEFTATPSGGGESVTLGTLTEADGVEAGETATLSFDTLDVAGAPLKPGTYTVTAAYMGDNLVDASATATLIVGKKSLTEDMFQPIGVQFWDMGDGTSGADAFPEPSVTLVARWAAVLSEWSESAQSGDYGVTGYKYNYEEPAGGGTAHATVTAHGNSDYVEGSCTLPFSVASEKYALAGFGVKVGGEAREWTDGEDDDGSPTKTVSVTYGETATFALNVAAKVDASVPSAIGSDAELSVVAMRFPEEDGEGALDDFEVYVIASATGSEVGLGNGNVLEFETTGKQLAPGAYLVYVEFYDGASGGGSVGLYGAETYYLEVQPKKLTAAIDTNIENSPGLTKTYDGTTDVVGDLAFTLSGVMQVGGADGGKQVDDVRVAYDEGDAAFDKADVPSSGETRTVTARNVSTLAGEHAVFYTLGENGQECTANGDIQAATVRGVEIGDLSKAYDGKAVSLPQITVVCDGGKEFALGEESGVYSCRWLAEDGTELGNPPTEVGNYRVAVHVASGNFSAYDGGGNPFSFSITPAASQMTLTVGESDADKATVTYGEKATFKATPAVVQAQSKTRSNSAPAITFAATPAGGGDPVVLGTVNSGVQVGAASTFEFDTADQRLAPGTYTVQAAYDGGGNYADALSNAVELTIQPKPVTIEGVAAKDKTYDGTVVAEVDAAGANLAGVLADGAGNPGGKGGPADDVRIDDSKAAAAFADANAGEGKTVTFSGFALSGEDAGFYALAAQPADTVADIAPAKLEVTPVGTVSYADDKPVFSVEASGWKGGDSSTLTAGLAVALDCSSSYQRGDNAGTQCSVTATWKDDAQPAAFGNYEISLLPGTLEVSQRTMTAAMFAAIEDQWYEGAPLTPEVAVSDAWEDLVGQDDFVVAYRNNDAPGAAKAVVSPAEGGNLTGDPVELNFAIKDASRRDFQLAASADTVTYGDAITATAVLPEGATATSISFSVNGGAAQAVEVDENGAASISLNTASFEGLAIGQNIVEACYVQADGSGGTATATATFQMEPYTVLAISSVKISKAYDGTVAAPEDFSLALWDVAPGDEGKVGIADGVAAHFDAPDAGERTLLVEQGSVKLVGERARFYELESDPGMYEFAGTIEQALPVLPEGSSVTAAGSLVVGDTLGKAALSGSFVSPVTGMSVAGALAWDAPGTALAAGENQQFAWTFTPDDANYAVVHGTAAVTVAEKAGSGGSGDTGGSGSGGSGGSGGAGGSGTGADGAGGKDAASGTTLAQTGDGLQAPILGAALLACAAASALTVVALRRSTGR